MVDDKDDDASREERRQQKHKEDFDPPRVRQCVTRIVCSRFSLSLVRRRTTPTTNTKRRLFIFLSRIVIAHVSLSLSFPLSLFSSTRWLHRFGLQKYSETLRKLTNEQFLELKLHPDFAKHEIFDTADKQKLQKAISVLRKERSKTTLGTVGRSPRTSEGGSSIVSSSSITTDSSLSSPRNTHTHATNGGAAKTPRNATGARKTSSNVQPQLQPQKQQQDKHQIVHQRKRTSNAVVAAPTSASASSSSRETTTTTSLTSDNSSAEHLASMANSSNTSANSNENVSTWQKNNLVNMQRSKNNNTDGNNTSKSDEDDDPRIRVVVRARPLAPREIAKNERNVCDADPDSKTLTVFEPKVKVDLTKYTETSEFVFDDVFGGYCSDDRVYDKTVSPLVRSVLCGGNATCFAYGQTGSGKTYTMAPLPTRAAKELLSGFSEFNRVFEEGKKREKNDDGSKDTTETSDNDEGDGQKIELWVSAYEIYGGKVYDLLASREKLRVLEDAKNQMQIVGLSEFLCENVSEVETLIERSALERCVGQTGANAESSRSHAVIQLWIKERSVPQKNRNGRQRSIYQRQQQHDLMMNSHRHPQDQSKRHHRKPLGKFSFIDLAGSERGADTTDTDRQTRAEGAEINKSLLALKECIRALDGGATHVPFRGSKLTEVLRDSFLGDSRTVMIACVSPAAGSCEHTLNTLRYADRVKELRSNVAGSLPSSSSSSSSSSIGEAPARRASLQITSSVATAPTKRRPAFDLSFCSPEEGQISTEKRDSSSSSSSSSSSVSSSKSTEKTLDRPRRPEIKKEETNENERSSVPPLNDDDDDDSETSHLLFEEYATSLSPPQLQRQHEKLIETILKEEFDLIDAHRAHVEQSVTRASDAAELLRVVDEPGSAVDEYVFALANSLERQRKELDQLSSRVRKFQSHLRKEDVLSKLNTGGAKTTTTPTVSS